MALKFGPLAVAWMKKIPWKLLPNILAAQLSGVIAIFLPCLPSQFLQVSPCAHLLMKKRYLPSAKMVTNGLMMSRLATLVRDNDSPIRVSVVTQNI